MREWKAFGDLSKRKELGKGKKNASEGTCVDGAGSKEKKQKRKSDVRNSDGNKEGNVGKGGITGERRRDDGGESKKWESEMEDSGSLY